MARRTRDGGINHFGWISGRQLWVDSLFMFGIFLAEMGRELSRLTVLKESIDDKARTAATGKTVDLNVSRKSEIKSILARSDKIVKFFDDQIAKKGERAIICDSPGH